MTETSGCRPESDDDEEKVDDHSEALGNEEKFLQEYGIEQCSCMHKLEMLPNTAITIVLKITLDKTTCNTFYNLYLDSNIIPFCKPYSHAFDA